MRMRTKKEILQDMLRLAPAIGTSLDVAKMEVLLDIRQILAALLLVERPFSGFNVEGDIITECAKIAGEKNEDSEKVQS